MVSELERDLSLARLGDYPGSAGTKRIVAAYESFQRALLAISDGTTVEEDEEDGPVTVWMDADELRDIARSALSTESKS